VSAERTWLRRAGRLDPGGGETVLWSVAEGRQGRRWRSLRLDSAGGVISSLVLELDPGGRWTRLELATSAGMLTLHPDPDARAAHGNVVTGRGVVPLEFAWSGRHRLVVASDPVAAAALRPPRDDDRAAGPGPGLVVGVDLTVKAGDTIAPAVAPPGGAPDGLPGPSWPLEP